MLLISVDLLISVLHWNIKWKAQDRDSSLHETPHRDPARHRRAAQWLLVCPYHKGTLTAYGITQKQETRSEGGFHLRRVHWRPFCCPDSQSSFLRLIVAIQGVRRTPRSVWEDHEAQRCMPRRKAELRPRQQQNVVFVFFSPHSVRGLCGNHFSFVEWDEIQIQIGHGFSRKKPAK